jgi:AI-2E family transporter
VGDELDQNAEFIFPTGGFEEISYRSGRRSRNPSSVSDSRLRPTAMPVSRSCVIQRTMSALSRAIPCMASAIGTNRSMPISTVTAAFLLLFEGGSGWAAAGVVGCGATVMLIGDYVLWPTLVGGAARLPFLLALVGIFGGLQVFGLLGVFLGPVIMAALLVVWREWLASKEG